MNKKAIAVFAAGATLLAGFAMATPAFAKDEAKGSKTEESKPVDAAKIAELKKAVKDADKKATLAGYKVDEEQAKYDKAKAQSQAEEAVVKQYNETLKRVKAAKKAKTTVDAGNDQEAKDKAALELTQAEKVHDASKKAVEDYNAALTDASLNAYKVDVANIKAGAAVADDSEDLKYTAASRADLLEAKAKKADADNELQAAKEALAKAEGKDTPAEPKHEGQVSKDPAHAGTKAQHIAALYGLKSELDDAEGNMNAKLDAYHKLFAKLSAVKAEMDAAKANMDAADQAVQDALAAGMNTSNPSAFKDLTERAARARAHYLGAQKAYNEVKADFDKAYREAVLASKAYNKALTAYKDAINAALAAGVKLPGDLPVLTDPLAELNLPVPSGVPTPTVPGQGQAGKQGKSEVEKKKNDGKKLPGTGVGVTLTALAATMLAGMGAAVRKARH